MFFCSHEAATIGVSFKIDGQFALNPEHTGAIATNLATGSYLAGEFPPPDITPPPAEEEEEQA